MRKNFITNIGFLLLLNLLVKPFWILGIDRSVQNVIGPDAYGTYFALFNFAYLFQVILDFGINNYNNRIIAGQPEKLGGVLVSTLALKLVLSVVYTILVFITAFGIHFSGEQLELLWLLILMQILMSFYAFLRSNVNALHLFKTDAVLSVLDKLLTSLICGIILWTTLLPFSISAEVFVYAQIIGYALSLFVAIAILGAQKMQIRFKIDKTLMYTVFRQSYPYALLGFLMTAYYRTDGVLLERLLGDEGAFEAGIYASAFRLLDALSIIGFLFAGLLMPMFSRLFANKEPIQPLLELGYKLMLVISVCVGVTTIFYRNEIMQLLYATGGAYSADILGWLMVSFIGISLTYIYGSLLTAGGRIRLLNKISLAGFLLNLILNLILIPEYKALGSAVATVFSQLLVLIAHVYLAGKQFSLPGTLKQGFQAVLFIIVVTGVNLLLSLLPVNWIIRYVLSGLISITAVFPSGVIRFGEIRPFIAGFRQALLKK
ncbi:MAG: oligosaccharide flippase family protein [Bacteroidetes bacterium]|nr:oligosaccharide flippase family protein [Bacteroidota bacterium]